MAQHLLRMEQAGVPIATPVGQPVVVSPDYRSTNFIFAVGSMANQNQPTMAEFAPPIVQALDPARTASANSFREMFTREVLVPWWVLGFVLEPGQQSVANWGEYFPQSLLGHRGSRTPYLMHHAFVFTAMQLHRTYTPVPSRDGPRTSPSLLATWFTGAPPGFTSTRDGVWANDEHRRLFERFAANVTRMQLLLVTQEAEDRCAAGARYASNTNGNDMDLRIESWLAGSEAVDPGSSVLNAAMAQRAYAALARLKRGCTETPAEGTGSGLAVQMSGDAGVLAGGHGTRRLEFAWPTAAGSTLRTAATGALEPRFTDAYRFSIDHGPNAQGTSRLWINGVLAVEAIAGQPARSTEVPLVAGQRVSLRLEFERTRGVGQGTRLRWEAARQLSQVVPVTQLYSR
jgi:PA14 domain